MGFWLEKERHMDREGLRDESCLYPRQTHSVVFLFAEVRKQLLDTQEIRRVLRNVCRRMISSPRWSHGQIAVGQPFRPSGSLASSYEGAYALYYSQRLAHASSCREVQEEYYIFAMNIYFLRQPFCSLFMMIKPRKADGRISGVTEVTDKISNNASLLVTEKPIRRG